MPGAPGVSMSARIEGLTCELTHGPSGTTLTTVPPLDNGGTGESFSPTDVVGGPSRRARSRPWRSQRRTRGCRGVQLARRLRSG